MFLDGDSFADGTELTADIAIVGAGPAGVALAARLGSDVGRVLVLESGGPTPTRDHDLARGFIDRPYYDLPETRLRGLGGSSANWGGWCERLRPADVMQRSWIPRSGWPLPYPDLVDYYGPAEEFCGIPKDFAMERIWSPGGRETPTLQAFDHVVFPVLGRRNLGARHRAIFDASNVDLITHATTTQIVVGGGGRRADRLVVRGPAGVTIHVVARTFVLAAGGIENPRLLLHSTSAAWPDGVGNGSGFVGRCFMEHPHVDAVRIDGTPRGDLDLSYFGEWDPPVPFPGPVRVNGALTLSDSTCAAEGVGRAQVFIESAGFHLDPSRPTIRRGRQVFAPRYTAPAHNELAVVVVSEQVPDPDSRVALSDVRDGNGVPLPVLQWRLNDLDHRTVRVAARHSKHVLAELGLTKARTRFVRGQWLLDTLGGPHHLGTTRMTQSDDDGVVDADCRVHHMSNLFIAGGSVFPTSGYAPPTLTIIAVAMRLADHLKADSTGR